MAASFLIDPSKGDTPQSVAQQRDMAAALASRILGRAPRNVGEGISAIGQALIARTMMGEANDAQKAGLGTIPSWLGGAASPQQNIASMISGGAPTSAPAESSTGQTPADAIAGIESGGKYDALGPVTNTGDRAYGKYQVMGANIPAWTKAHLGQEMTPEQFLANPQAQDAVFKGQFGQYAQKYGNEGAARAWFAGEGGMNNPNAKDQLGTTVAQYAQKFNAGMGQPQPSQNGLDYPNIDSPRPDMPVAVNTTNDGLQFPNTVGDQSSIPPAARPTGPAQSRSGPSIEQLIQAASNPWLNPGQRAVVNTMLQQRLTQQQQANDPLRQLQIRKAERDLADGKNPESVREYEYAVKSGGYKGSFQDWIATKRAGAGEFGLDIIYGTDEKGNVVGYQAMKSGGLRKIDLPPGQKLAPGTQKIDRGTHWDIINSRTGQTIAQLPKDLRGEAREKALGAGEGEAAVSLESINSKMPGLEAVVDRLEKLSDEATYTYAGQGLNWSMRQLGFEPSDAAVARSNYISMVDNQVLPLLRDTFGAAFTQKEGDTLRNTLGDPDKSPKEKKAVLKSFIEQKRRDVEALERRVRGGSAPNVPAPPSATAAPSVDDLLKKYGNK